MRHSAYDHPGVRPRRSWLASVDWLDVAYACGYFDFSHLMRDFRQFADVPPSLLLAQEMRSPDRQPAGH